MAPLHTSRIIVLSLSFAFGIIGLAAGANSIAKSNHMKHFVQAHIPIPNTVVDIDTSDLVSIGGVLSAGCILLALVSLSGLITSLLRKVPSRLEGFAFAFCTVWIFACNVPNTVIARDRSAEVSATIGGSPIDPTIVAQQQAALGISSVYWHDKNERFFAVVTWITFLFAVLATIVSFKTSGTRKPSREEEKA